MLAEQHSSPQKAFSDLYNLQTPFGWQEDLAYGQQRICQIRVLLFAEP
jgi:hypothetical protein